MSENKGRVLIIAGSDSGGGAGIQADIKTVTALGGYAATAVTAVTVQNTLGVTGAHPIPAAMVETVARVLDSARTLPAVIDPVMVARGGTSLLAAEAVAAVRTLLIPRASL